MNDAVARSRLRWPIKLFLLTISAVARAQSSEPLQPLPLVPPSLNREVVALGRLLFNDPRLSHDNSVSCSSCHAMGLGGADGQPHSVGIGGAVGDVNAPTVFNSGYNYVQFWDGRAASLEAQVGEPVMNPKEMGSKDWAEVLKKIGADPDLRSRGQRAFGRELDMESVSRAIADYERTLVTPNSRFDRYLRGERSAINEIERRGYTDFKMFGCSSCHQGVNVGGNMFQKLGIMRDYFADAAKTRPLTQADNGRYNVTKVESDRHVFRVPSLRNVELTAPYFHDGSRPTLEAAVKAMALYQLGRKISDQRIAEIVAFLKTLTGEQPLEEKPR